MLKCGRLQYLLLFLLFLSMAACDGDGSGDGDEDRTFSLPAGIEVANIIGDARFHGERCIVRGNGTEDAYFIYLTLVNTTAVAIEVTIPSGLIFTPVPDLGDLGPQQMMVTQDTTFIVETGAHSFCIWVNCVGGGDTPTETYQYTFGNFIQDECRLEIIDLLRGKHLSAMSGLEVAMIFDMIRHCPYQGLSDDDREFLRSLP